MSSHSFVHAGQSYGPDQIVHPGLGLPDMKRVFLHPIQSVQDTFRALADERDNLSMQLSHFPYDSSELPVNQHNAEAHDRERRRGVHAPIGNPFHSDSSHLRVDVDEKGVYLEEDWVLPTPNTPPNSPLVGVELNPGPPKSSPTPKVSKGVAKHKGSMALTPKVKSLGLNTTTRIPTSLQRTQNQLLNLFPTGNANITGYSRITRIIKEDEYLGNINGSTTFFTTKYFINIGNTACFPWGSFQASQYERYRVVSLQFYYRPTVSATNTSGTKGKVLLSADYDPNDQPPSTRQIVEDTDPHSDGMPYENVVLTLDPRQLTPKAKFVRGSGLPGGADISNYDAGSLYVSTDATADNTVIGELRVRYVIELTVPILQNVTTVPLVAAPIQTVMASGSNAPVSTVPTPFGGWVKWNDNSGVNINASSGSVSMPTGIWVVKYDFTITITGGVLTVLVPDVQYSGGGGTLYGGVGTPSGNSPNMVVGAASVTTVASLSTTLGYVSIGTGSIGQIYPLITAVFTGTAVCTCRLVLRRVA